MAGNKRKSNQHNEVRIEHGDAPDAQERLIRIYALILRAAARAEGEADADVSDDH